MKLVPTCLTCVLSGIDCDMSVGGLGATFKCRVLRALGTIDARFPAMVRVVKTWARARGLNDSSNGTMNSFALSLLVRSGPVATRIPRDMVACACLRPWQRRHLPVLAGGYIE